MLAQFSAEPLEQIVCRTGVCLPVKLPERVEQLLTADGAILMRGQVSEKIEFSRGQRKGFAVKRCAAQGGRKRQRAEFQLGRRFSAAEGVLRFERRKRA